MLLASKKGKTEQKIGKKYKNRAIFIHIKANGCYG